jgi:hypothetical protein
MPDTPEYAVGRGKPPMHTRFKKGQSGNPSGKPGPAKLVKQRFRQLVHQALGKEKIGLRFSEPRTSLESMANRLVSDAAWGKPMSMRILLSLLDAEIAEDETSDFGGDETDCEQDAPETPPADNASP